MTPEERQMLADLFERIRATGAAPRDPQAEAFINDAVRACPTRPMFSRRPCWCSSTRWKAPQQRISELEAQAGSAAAQPAQETSFLGILGRKIFGGGVGARLRRSAARRYDASAYQRRAAPRSPGYRRRTATAAAGSVGRAAAAGGGFLSGALQRRPASPAACSRPMRSKACSAAAAGSSAARVAAAALGGSGLGLRRRSPRGVVNNYYGTDPADQQREDVLQDADQDQDDAQDAGYDDGGGLDDGGSYDT